MRFLDLHVHTYPLSDCSGLSEDQLAAFYLEHQEFVVTVSDHQSLGWYDRFVGKRKMFSPAETLYSTELSFAPGHTDLVLTTYDLDAFAPLRPVLARGERYLQQVSQKVFQVIRDPRVLVVWAHPEDPKPSWLEDEDFDFIEFNYTHLWLVNDELGLMRYLEWLGREHPDKLFIVGSDSHSTFTLGETFVSFNGDVRTGEEAWGALKAGAFTNHMNFTRRQVGGFRAGGIDKETLTWTFTPQTRTPLVTNPRVGSLEKMRSYLSDEEVESLIMRY